MKSHDYLGNEINPIDVHVGKKVRERRQRLGWTLMELAEKMGVSHQQVQKYEQGTTRISASALFHLSKIFQTNQDYFFSGIQLNNQDVPEMEETDTIRLHADRPRQLNVVLVEDDSGDELLLRKALEDLDLELKLHTLHDGDSAIHFLRHHHEQNLFPRPDLIILDLNIPKRDGHMILKDIKRDRKLQDIPVVVLTNSLSKKEMVSVYRNGASGYICKAFDFNVFKEYMRNVFLYWGNTVILPYRS